MHNTPFIENPYHFSCLFWCSGRNGDASKLGSDREGVMQVQYGGRKGFICDNEWDMVDAHAACLEFDQYNLDGTLDTSPERE